MKELTIEQKAKAYDRALEIAKAWCKLDNNDLSNDDLKTIFPELKESEDERIRKELIEYVKDQQSSFISAPDCRDKYEEEENNKYNAWIAWLEKQDTPNQTSIWKHWKDGIAGNGEGELIYLVKDGNTYSLNSCLSFECDYIELSELDKLKPANKMESFCIPRYAIENIQIAIKVFEKERHAPLANALRETMRRLEERWKPTDLQLDCLSDAIERYNSEGYPADVLKTLLRQLKEIG